MDDLRPGAGDYHVRILAVERAQKEAKMLTIRCFGILISLSLSTMLKPEIPKHQKLLREVGRAEPPNPPVVAFW